jgi:site-specific DNA-methyltransferase (adenine-specific)
MWKQLKRIGKNNNPYIFFATTKFGYKLIQSNEKWFRYDLVWDKAPYKVGHLNAKKMPMRQHEMIYIFYKNLPSYNLDKHKVARSEVIKGSVSSVYGLKDDAMRRRYDPPLPTSIISGLGQKKTTTKRYHPTEKSVGILEWLIEHYTNKGDVVLDFTMGSGSTGLACRNLERKFIGIELDPKYFEIAQNRIFTDYKDGS